MTTKGDIRIERAERLVYNILRQSDSKDRIFAANGGCQGVSGAGGGRDAGGPVALGFYCREHLLFRSGFRRREDDAVRADGRYPRGDHENANGLQQPGRRHGKLAVRWPETASAARPRAL